MSSKTEYETIRDFTEDLEYKTLSSDFSPDTAERPERLHAWLKSEEIESLHYKFLKKGKLSYPDLREELENLNIKFTHLEYNRLFLKISENRNSKCDWDEFISYLLNGFREDHPTSTRDDEMTLPIHAPPLIRTSEHHSPVCCIALLKTRKMESTEDHSDSDSECEERNFQKFFKKYSVEDTVDWAGIFITASREGQLRFWSKDLKPLRAGKSNSAHQKVRTWILCIGALSDVKVVCTSSTERELRFHETVTPSFSLRAVILSMPYAVHTMQYSHHEAQTSRLIMGDYGGSVRILEFDARLKSPFQSKSGRDILEMFWSDIAKGKFPQLRCREYLNVHTEMIQHVYFARRLNCTFAAAEYRNIKKYRGRCPGLVILSGEDKSTFRIPLGVTTFCVDERHDMVVTGGPDTSLRIWDIYVPTQPTGLLTGHNSGIVYVFVQSEEKKIYSVDYLKIIKVWELSEHTLLQTFDDLVRIIPSETDLVFHYHRVLRILLIGGRKLVAIKCNPRVNIALTDGNTHTAPVSVVLYNRLFRNVVTCGLDSFVIVWDPWSGKRRIIIKDCHIEYLYGEKKRVEITAACFDPLERYLLTGARDGCLKIWNYNNAVCIRNLKIKGNESITAVRWVKERILAVGWDQQVTEFPCQEGNEYTLAKKWPMFHHDDITCADVKVGEGVVTASYYGELIFWRLETGQPYRCFNVAQPREFIELRFNKYKKKRKEIFPVTEPHFPTTDSTAQFMRLTALEMGKQMINALNARKQSRLAAKIRRRSESLFIAMSVQAVLFLQTRRFAEEHGDLLVALETGTVQVYSHHHRGGFITQFNAIHRMGDCVLAMTTDRKERYLFTGTACGYIKLWHIQNLGMPPSEKVRISMPLLRLKFIFLRRDTFLLSAKRAVRYQKEPLLLSSYKAHLAAITSTVFVHLSEILITGSNDCSVRLWTIGGRYLGTLGTPLPWMKLSPFEAFKEEARVFRLSPDIKNVASTTTMKVISGVQPDRVRPRSKKVVEEKDLEEENELMRIYAKHLREPILGEHFQHPAYNEPKRPIKLKTFSSPLAKFTPVYTHVEVYEANHLELPSTTKRLAVDNYLSREPTTSALFQP